MKERISSFEQALSRQGIDAALAVLNKGVPHRFTGIFWRKGELMHTRFLFDKRGQATTEFTTPVPAGDAFCHLVLRIGSFETRNSAKENLLDYSSFQGIVIAYHAVAIDGPDGNRQGSLCHFDFVEQSILPDEMKLLTAAAKLLEPHLADPSNTR